MRVSALHRDGRRYTQAHAKAGWPLRMLSNGGRHRNFGHVFASGLCLDACARIRTWRLEPEARYLGEERSSRAARNGLPPTWASAVAPNSRRAMARKAARLSYPRLAATRARARRQPDELLRSEAEAAGAKCGMTPGLRSK